MIRAFHHNGFWQPMDTLRDKILSTNFEEGSLHGKFGNEIRFLGKQNRGIDRPYWFQGWLAHFIFPWCKSLRFFASSKQTNFYEETKVRASKESEFGDLRDFQAVSWFIKKFSQI